MKIYSQTTARTKELFQVVEAEIHPWNEETTNGLKGGKLRKCPRNMKTFWCLKIREILHRRAVQTKSKKNLPNKVNLNSRSSIRTSRVEMWGNLVSFLITIFNKINSNFNQIQIVFFWRQNLIKTEISKEKASEIRVTKKMRSIFSIDEYRHEAVKVQNQDTPLIHTRPKIRNSFKSTVLRRIQKIKCCLSKKIRKILLSILEMICKITHSPKPLKNKTFQVCRFNKPLSPTRILKFEVWNE